MAVSGIIVQMITLFIMMFAGYLAARAGLISPSFRRGLSSLVRSTAFPCCIVSSVLQSGGAPGDMVVALGVSVAFFALLIALAATLRLFFCAPAQVAKRQKNANDALLVWYRAAEDALLCMGLSSLPGEAPASFLWRAQCELHDAVKLTGLGKALCVAQYSGRTLKPIQPERARKVYAELLAQMTFRQRLRLYVRRLIHGLRLS